MTFVCITIIIILILAALYVYALWGCTGHPSLKELRKWSYAHRGLHGDGRPENSMAAFRAALESGYGIELDIHLMADGELAVIHDSCLKRVAGVDVMIEDLTANQLQNYKLENTEETIPMFRQVLELFDGKAPMIVELKATRCNHNALAAAAAKILDNYNGSYCIESFDPKCVRWFARNRTRIVRGQLSANFLKEKGKMPWIIRFVMTHNLLNFWTRPDFIAYDFKSRNTLSNIICRRLWKMQGIAWTLKSQQEYDTAVAEGWLPIFEGFNP